MAVKLLSQEVTQAPIVASGVINFNDLNPNNADAPISSLATHSLLLAKLPGNAIMIGGYLTVVTAWVGPTTATLDIGDDEPTADPDKYTASAINLKAVGSTALTASAVPTTQIRNLTGELINNAGTAASAGKAIWTFMYVVTPGRANEVFG